MPGRPFPDMWQLRHETHAQHRTNYNLYYIAWQVGIKTLYHGGRDVHAGYMRQPGYAGNIDDERPDAQAKARRIISAVLEPENCGRYSTSRPVTNEAST